MLMKMKSRIRKKPKRKEFVDTDPIKARKHKFGGMYYYIGVAIEIQ